MGSSTPPPSSSIDRLRRNPRYAAEIEVHVSTPGRSLVTVTREISRSGLFFFADPAPEIGEQVRLVLHPDGRSSIPVQTTVRYVLEGVGAGVEVNPDTADAAKFRAFVDDQSSAHKAWQAIGGFVRSALDSADLGPAQPSADFEQKEMVDVGESGEAYRVLFELYPAVAPARTILASHPEALGHAKDVLVGVSVEPVGIKLNSKDRLRRMHIGILKQDRSFAAILLPKHVRDRFAFYSLSGREQIMIKEGDRPVFPFFGPMDLKRIRADGVSEVHSGKEMPAIPMDEKGFISGRYATALQAKDSGEFREELVHDLRDSLRAPSVPGKPVTRPDQLAKTVQLPSLSQWTRYEGVVQDVVRGLFDLFGAESRVYRIGSVKRDVRLLRNLTVVVRLDESAEPEEGILLHDGKRVCVMVGMKTRESMRIRPLADGDEIKIPAW